MHGLDPVYVDLIASGRVKLLEDGQWHELAVGVHLHHVRRRYHDRPFDRWLATILRVQDHELASDHWGVGRSDHGVAVVDSRAQAVAIDLDQVRVGVARNHRARHEHLAERAGLLEHTGQSALIQGQGRDGAGADGGEGSPSRNVGFHRVLLCSAFQARPAVGTGAGG